MRFSSLLRVETGRLLHARSTWLGIALAATSPIVGLIYRPLMYSSANGSVLGNLSLSGALIGAIVFALLTAYGLHNRQRFRTEEITNAVHSVFQMNLSQTLSLLFSAVVAQVAVLIVWLPYSVIQLGSIFSFGLYISVYLSIMLPTVCFAVLFIAAVYQITRRFDLSLVLFAAFLLLSFTVWSKNWIACWVNPALSYLSDDFGNTRRLMSIWYNRLFWILVLCGLWSMSFICVRRYGMGLFGSVFRNMRRVYIPVIAVVLVCSGGFSYAAQPFLDNSADLINYTGVFTSSLYTDEIYCESIHVDARPNLATGKHYGTASYMLQNSKGEKQTLVFSINPGYRVSSATANGQPVTVRDMKDDDMNSKTIEVDIPAEKKIRLDIEYGGLPTEWNIMSMLQGSVEISRDYIYLANDGFSPRPISFSSSGAFTADINLPRGMIPVIFGKGTAEELETNSDSTVHWQLRDSGGNIILYAGDYVSYDFTASDIDIEFIFSQKHSRIMEEYDVYSVIKNVFEFCTEYIGKLSFVEDGKMKLIEIGSFGGGYAGAGASVMGEDSFNEKGLSDPLKGAGGGEVLAHEIIHQWWGLGNMFDASDENSLWSAEGLTVYTTYRLMKKLYGEEYATKNYVDVWQREVDNYYNNFYVRNPEYIDVLPEKYQAGILNGFTTMRRYCEMPLMILKAEQLVGGEEVFDEILYDMFNREYNEDYSNLYLSYDLFLEYCGLTEEDVNIE